jgi:hypothetical protein
MRLDHRYGNGEFNERQRAQEWVPSRMGEDGDMAGMPELISNDDSSSKGSDIEVISGPDRARDSPRPKRRWKFGERFQAWATRLGMRDVPTVVLALQKQAGTGGYTMVEEEDWASSEDEGASEWSHLAR